MGLLRALDAYERTHMTAGAMAEVACDIEIDMLGEPVGWTHTRSSAEALAAAIGALARDDAAGLL